MDDRELVRRILRHDRAAAEALVHENAALIYTVFRRQHDDPDHVERSFNQFFTRLAANDYQLLHSWNGECRLRTFLAAHALRMVIDARNETGETECDLSEELLPPLRRALNEALDTLCASDRRIIQLRRFDGLGFRDIAMRLDMSSDAAAVTLHRAEKRLRDQVSMTFPALFEDFVR